MSDIEILSVDPKDNWPSGKKKQFEHLQLLSKRIVEKGTDITSNFGSDYFPIRLVYAIFGDQANKDFHTVCSLAKDYDYDRCQDDFKESVEKTKLKTLRKLITICRFYEIDTTFEDESADSEAALYFLPESVDRNFVLQQGFYPHVDGANTGYFFRTGETTFKAQSNFVITPLMHVYSKQDNKRIIAIDNGFRKAVIDIASKDLISLDQFRSAVYDEGNYMFWGVKTHLLKILSTINERFPICYELKTLGWQQEGFFAYSDAVYDPKVDKLTDFNELGIAEVDDTNYFSPSASDIYRNVRADDDEYENDRYLSVRESPIDFEKWMRLMMDVYEGTAMTGIGYIFIGLFKDIIFKIDNNCPLLSCYGEKGSGKSKFAESLCAIFLNDLQPFNLNHGTDFAFFNRLSRFRNCITWFDEFDDQAIKEDRFQSIKGAYDGAGRERGKGGSRNRTEIARINSALMLTGQYLSTRDDNAALTRCIVVPFRPKDDRSREQISKYEKLKTIEKRGISSLLTEILKYRKEFEKEYVKTFPETFNEIKEAILNEKSAYKERVVRNYTALLNSVKFFTKKFEFPFTYADFFERCRQDVIMLSTLISESDSLADFWNTIVYLLDVGDIVEGFHFKIKEETSVRIGQHGERKDMSFPVGTKILYLRLTTVHKLYMEAFRRQNGKTGINMQSLQLYISSSKAFVGIVNAQRFVDSEGRVSNTSAYAFNYETLEVPLDRTPPDEDPEREVTEVLGLPVGGYKTKHLMGKPMLVYAIKTTSTYKKDGHTVEKDEITHCIDADLQNSRIIEPANEVRAQGYLKLKRYKDQAGNDAVKRTLEVESVELVDEQLSFPEEQDDLPF